MSKRRCAAGPKSKTTRLDDHSAASQVTTDVRIDDSTWQREAGMILKVQLQNFMCHQNFTYEPNTKLNFLCGENGTGKSAVLTAIIFALGGSARVANRGTSNKCFIRSGQSQATVEIQLWNGGQEAFRPDVYGNVISIVRTVTSSGGGGYKIKSESGKVVPCPKVREELDKMLTSFGIQVENPIAVLNQDTAKSFLYKCDSFKMYDFFMRATQLEACKEDYTLAEEDKNVAEVMFKEKQSTLPQLKREVDKWNKKLQLLQSFRERNTKLKKKRTELAWAVVIKAESVHNNACVERQKLEAKIEKCRLKQAEEAAALKELQERKLALEREIQEIADQADADQDAINAVKVKLTKAREDERKLSRQVADLKSQESAKQKESELLKVEIVRIKKAGGDEFEVARKKRDDEIRSLEEEVESNEKKKTAILTQAESLTTSLDAVKGELRERQAQVTNLRGKMGTKLAELKALEGKRNRLVVFGEKMPQLVAAIKKTQFKKAPVGPLGAEINLKPDVTPEQARAVEMELGRLLTTFVVDNLDDRRVLDGLQQSCHTNFPIIVSKFCDAAYNIASARCRHPQFPAVVDLLVVSSPVAFNCLVNQKRIESVLVLPTEEVAQELFMDEVCVPVNCVMGLTHNCCTHYPAPNYRTYTLGGDRRGQRTVLQSSVEEVVQGLKKELQDLKSKIEVESKKPEEVQQRITQTQVESASCEKQIAQINLTIKDGHLRLGQLKTDAETSKPSDVLALEEDLQLVEEEREQLRGQRQEAEKALEKGSQVSAEARAVLDREKVAFDTKSSRSEPRNEELGGIQARTKKHDSQKNYFRGKETEYAGLLNEAKEREASADKKRVEMLQVAKGWRAERQGTEDKSADAILQEVALLQESLKKQEEIKETFEEVTAKVEKLYETYQKRKKQARKMESHITDLKEMLEKRQRGFSDLRESISRRVRIHFSMYLETRKFAGSLIFSHLEHTLEIAVAPEGGSAECRRDLKTLSGGEKSYCTISLILALWDVMNPPFRVLDEFDVFMDMVNRRTALNQITDYAREARKFQYVFLTPLNTEGLKIDDDIKIIKLEKNQG